MSSETLPSELKDRLGQSLGCSDWVLLDQARIQAFADATLDQQFIHTDPQRAAAETPFGGSIAHGFLGLSLGSAMMLEKIPPLPGQVMALNYGFDRVRFLAPVPTGSRVRGQFVLKDATPRPPLGYVLRLDYRLEIEGQDKPALIADWLVLSQVKDGQ